MTRRRCGRTGLLLLLLLTACRDPGSDDSPSLPIPQQTYVEVMAELARLRRRPPPARGAPERERLADSIRTEILARHHVSPEQILAFAEAAGRDPAFMLTISQAIAELSDSMDAELAAGESGVDRPDLEVDPARENPVRRDRSIPETSDSIAPPADRVPGARFATPATDTLSDPEFPPGGVDSLPAGDRTPARPERRPVRRPEKSRPPQ
jgi:hypothetical protein